MRAFAYIGCVALFSAAAALAEDTAATDPASGMVYPQSVAGFQRLATEPGPDGALAAVYRKGSDNLTITVSTFKTSTVFVMAGMPKSRDDIDRAYCMNGIGRVADENASNVTQSADTTASVRHGSASRDGFLRSFTRTRADFAGAKNVAVKTDIYRFCFLHNVWTIQYRVDYLPIMDGDAKAFLNELDWTRVGDN